MKSKLGVFFTILCIFAGSMVQAATEEFVSSIVTGTNAYLIVTAGGDGGSHRVPGVYVRDQEGWRMALPGAVAVHPRQGPVLQQLGSSLTDRLSQSVIVIDGHLTILSQNTVATRPETFLRLGSEWAPIIHPVTKHKILLPSIQNLANVTLAESRAGDSSILLISVQGEGGLEWTFGLVIRPCKADGTLVTQSSPVLIDQKFHGHNELLAILSRMKVESLPAPLYGQHYIHLMNSIEGPNSTRFDSWKESLLRDLYAVRITWDLKTVQMPNLPNFSLSTAPSTLNILQRVDPLKMDRWVEVNQRRMATGMVDVNSRGEPLLQTLVNGELNIGVMSVDHDIKLVTPEGGVPLLLGSHWNNFALEFLSMRRKEGSGNLFEVFLLVSRDTPSLDDIGIYVVEIDPSRRISNGYWLKQTIENFFLDRDGLRASLMQVDRHTYLARDSSTPEGLAGAIDLTNIIETGRVERGLRKKVGDHFYLHISPKGNNLVRASTGEILLQGLSITEPIDVWIQPANSNEPNDYIVAIREPGSETETPAITFYRLILLAGGKWDKTSFSHKKLQHEVFGETFWKRRFQAKDRRWVFDFSKDLDGSDTIDVFETIIQQKLLEDMASVAQRDRRSRGSVISSELGKRYPGLSFSIDDALNVQFPSANFSAPVYPKITQIHPTTPDSILAKHALTSPFGTSIVSFLPTDTNSRGGFVGVREYQDGDQTLHQVFRLEGATDFNWNRWTRYDRPVKILANANKTVYNIFFEVEREHDRRDEENPNSDVKSPRVLVEHIFLRFNSSTGMIETAKIQTLGNLEPGTTLDSRLATHPDLGLMWLSDGNLDARATTLMAFESGRKITPNVGTDRVFRPQITYYVPRDKRPVYPKDLEAEIRSEALFRRLPSEVAKLISRDQKLNVHALQMFQPVGEKLESYLAHRDGFPMLVLTAPPELKPLLLAYLAQSYGINSSSHSWSQQNSKFRVFTPDSSMKYTQSQVVDALDVMANLDPEHNIFFMNVGNIWADGRPTDNINLYSTTQTRIRKSADTKTGDAAIQEEAEFPHISFMMASQGDTSMTYEKIRHVPPRTRFPSILVATPAEWNHFLKEGNTFYDFGAENWFEQFGIDNPSIETRIQLLRSVFENKNIQSFNLKFDAQGIKRKDVTLTQQEEMAAILRFAANRVDSLSRGLDRNPLSIFFEYLDMMTESILNDRRLKLDRVVNKAFIENTLSRKFNIPLNRSNLAADDPLFVMSQPDAVIRFQDAGYMGNPILRRRLLDIFVNQMAPAETRSLPSSVIVAGDTGSGKSHIFEVLTKWLHLKLYDFSATTAETNREAQAFVIKADKLMAKGSSMAATGMMDVDDLLKHLENFLSKPNGYRGYILIDDLHGAPEPVREKILVFIRSLMEAKDGMYETSEKTVEYTGRFSEPVARVKRPIRGISLIVTMNFTENQEAIKRYTKAGETPTLEQMIVATLSTSNFSVEKSLLARFGDIIPLSNFSTDAKGLSLVKAFKRKQQDLLELRNRFVVLSPVLVKLIVQAFPNEDARTFLAHATDGLFNASELDGTDSSAMILVPAPQDANRTVVASTLPASISQSAHNMQTFIAKNAQPVAIDNGYEGRLQLISVLMNSYRLFIFEQLFSGLQEHPLFSDSPDVQRYALNPMLHALFDHVTMAETMPVSELKLDAHSFGLKQSDEIDRFSAYVKKLSVNRFFPLSFSPPNYQTAFLELTSSRIAPRPSPNRRSVLHDHFQALIPVLGGELATQMRVPNLRSFPPVEAWFHGLVRKEPDGLKLFQKQLVEQFLEFKRDLFADNLQEMIDANSNSRLSPYDVARLYLYAIDRAVTRLDWPASSGFLAKVVQAASEDLTLSQSPGFQFYFRDSVRSVFNVKLSEHLISTVSNFPAFEGESADLRKRQPTEFAVRCEQLFNDRVRK